ncbi:MAG: two-component regulator propeller domain-containing protein, partial [Rhodothermales bacterium]
MIRCRRFIQLLLAVLIVGCWGGMPAWSQSAFPLNADKQLTQFRFDQWTAEQGLPMNRVQTLLQTSDGYVWMGTQEGLVRFDGFDFHIFDSKNSPLQSNDVGDLAQDEAGNLWIATSYDGLARFRHGRFTSYRVEDGLTSDQVYAVTVDRSGRVWAGTQTGVSVLEGDSLAPLDVGSAFREYSIRSIHQDDAGVIWFGTQESGLIRLDGRDFTRLTTADGLPSDEITSLAGGVDGSVLVGTKGGLVIFDGDAMQLISSADGLPNDLIRSARADAQGTIWIGTEEGGLSRYVDGRMDTYPTDRLSSVFDVMVDMEGSLWIGTQREGLGRLQDGKFTVFTAEEGLSSSSVYSVVQDAAGDVWVGTIDEGVNRLTDGRFTSYTTENGFPTNSIGGLYGSRNGDVWIGTRGAGLVRYRDGNFRHYTVSDGLPDDQIYNIFEDSRGVLWMGSYKEGLIRFDGRRFVTFTTEDGLSHNAITAIVEGPDGYLWLGTYRGGVNLMKDGVVIHTYTTDDGLPQDNVNSLYRDEEGVVWIATQEGGLSRLRDGRLATLTAADGLYSENILQILEDDLGYLWFSSNTGLFKVDKEQIHETMDGRLDVVESTVYDRSDGLTTTEFNGGLQPAGWKDRDGNLWFVSSAGLVCVDPNDMPVNELAPPVVIERVIAGDEPMRLDTTMVLEAGRNRLEVDFIGLSYIANDEIVYRYMLDGVDDGWVEAGGRRQAFYTNLSPGQYTFRVMARNADGVWSAQPASISFYLEPFFYQTWWFFGLMALALMFSGVGVYRLRVRQLKARQRELEQIVDERTRDLREEKEKVEQAKEVIEEQADQLREMDRVKTRFFGNISHEFRTPLTLNIGPLENAMTGLYGPVPDPLKKQLSIMLRNARRLLRLINQLLDISKLESGRMELKPKRLDLVQFLEGVVMSFTGFTEKNDI